MSGLFGVALIDGASPDAALDVANRIAAALRVAPHQQIEVSPVAPGVAVGRLRAGVLNRAAQPWTGPSGRLLWLTGEIYQESGPPIDGLDVPTLGRVFDEGNPSALAGLNGMFLAASWDDRTGTLYVTSDRYGLYQCCYATTAAGLVFAPRMRPLLDAAPVPRRVDPVAIGEYVRYQQLLGDRTWLADVRLLPPASVLAYDTHRGRLTLDRYWDWDRVRLQDHHDFDSAVETVAGFERRAIERRLDSRQRTGVYLSGGLDSRRILGVAARHVPVTTITYGTPGSRDVVLARRLARRAGATHHWMPFRDARWILECAPLHLALTEGQHSWIHSHGMSTLRAARDLIDINLSGWAGGSPYWVVDRHLVARMAGRTDAEGARVAHEAFARAFTWPGLTDTEASALLRHCEGTPLAPLAFESMAGHLAATAAYAPERRLLWLYTRHHDRRLTLNFVSFSRSAFDVRCPFADSAFLDYVYTLPEALLAAPRFQSSVASSLAPALATIPRDKDWRLPHPSRLISGPHALLWRTLGWLDRRGVRLAPRHATLYADYEHDLRHELRPWAEALLFHPRTLDRGFYHAPTLRTLWDRHVSGHQFHTIGTIAPVMAIEMALRYLVDGDTPPAACGLGPEVTDPRVV